MLPLLFSIAVLAQWFLAPLGLMGGTVLVLYACIFTTIALRQWVWVMWCLMMAALLVLFGAASLMLIGISAASGVVLLGLFSRYVDVSQAAIRTATLCLLWSAWIGSVLLSYHIGASSVYVTTIAVHIVFIAAWSLSSSVKGGV